MSRVELRIIIIISFEQEVPQGGCTLYPTLLSQVCVIDALKIVETGGSRR